MSDGYSDASAETKKEKLRTAKNRWNRDKYGACTSLECCEEIGTPTADQHLRRGYMVPLDERYRSIYRSLRAHRDRRQRHRPAVERPAVHVGGTLGPLGPASHRDDWKGVQPHTIGLRVSPPPPALLPAPVVVHAAQRPGTRARVAAVPRRPAAHRVGTPRKVHRRLRAERRGEELPDGVLPAAQRPQRVRREHVRPT